MIGSYLEGFHASPGETSIADLQEKALGNESMAAELLLRDLIREAETARTVRVNDADVPLGDAVAALKQFEGRLELDAVGAVLFREWLDQYVPHPSHGGLLLVTEKLFEVAFDHRNPLDTPHSLANQDNLALTNLAKALQILENESIKPDVRLGELQRAYTDRAGSYTPVHGGQHWEGVSNAIYTVPETPGQSGRVTFSKVEGSAELTEGGYPINAGGTYIATIEFTRDGPRGYAFLVYGQTADSKSPHSGEQIERFASKRWRPILFKRSDIEKASRSGVTLECTRSGQG